MARIDGGLFGRLALVFVAGLFVSGAASADSTFAPSRQKPDPAQVAVQVDGMINAHLARRGVETSPAAGDSEFLRRVSLDLTGEVPTPEQITLFVLDPDARKRTAAVDRLLGSEAYARNWARYWRDAILYRASDRRADRIRPVLEEWLAEQFAADRGWDEIVEAMLTASGEVRSQGSTALLLAQMVEPVEVAAETSRLFLGIQIQCAQCHDHPYDDWTREQFHEMAAFFARVRLARAPGTRAFVIQSRDYAGALRFANRPDRLLARLDVNGDGKLQRNEARGKVAEQFDRLLARADLNNDKALSPAELKTVLQQVGRRGGVEYYMPDLERPERRGTLVHPRFFLTGTGPRPQSADLVRRENLARLLTARDNPWFARAFVNRIWAEMMGQGFCEPVDDIDPSREVAMADVLDLLAEGWQQSGYSLRWLLATIARTDAYQREVRPRAASPDHPRFAAVCPTRLTADQLFGALAGALGIETDASARDGRNAREIRGARRRFGELFGFDPSLPADEVAGTVPQALFLMNSPVVNNRIRARGNTELAQLLDSTPEDTAVVHELYLRTLSRQPSEKELEACLGYVGQVGDRGEAFEDILWALLNSTEFLTNP